MHGRLSHPDVPGGATSHALASAVDLVPTLLDFGVDEERIAADYPALHGHSLVPALEGETVREGVLTAVETITTLDAGFWTHFADPDVGARIRSGELRPDWTKHGFLRGYTDERYTFGRYFSPLEPNRPGDVDELMRATTSS